MEITFDRNDVTEIQLAKAAMRAGEEILLKKAGITAEDVDKAFIAGSFGTYLDVQRGSTSACSPAWARIASSRWATPPAPGARHGAALAAGARAGYPGRPEGELRRALVRAIVLG